MRRALAALAAAWLVAGCAQALGLEEATVDTAWMTGAGGATSTGVGGGGEGGAGGGGVGGCSLDLGGTVFGGSAEQVIGDVAVDSEGNIIAVGSFESDLGFMDLSTTGNSGDIDGFVVKLAPDGSLMWARSIKDTLVQRAESVVLDADDNIYVVGRMQGEFDFGNVTLTAPGSQYRAYVARYAPTGTVDWARFIGDFAMSDTVTFSDSPFIARAGSELVVAMEFGSNSTAAEPINFAGTDMSAPTFGQPSLAIGTLDPADGAPTWGTFVGCTGGCNAEALIGTGDGFLVSASGTGVVYDGPGSENFGDPNSMNRDAMLLRFDHASGASSLAASALWAQDGSESAVTGIVELPSSGFAVVGTYTGNSSLDVDGLSFPGPGSQNQAMLVAGLGSNLQLQWLAYSKDEDGGNAADERGVAIALSGNTLYVAGSVFDTTTTFDDEPLAAAGGSTDLALLAMTIDGTTLSATRYQGVGIERPQAMVASCDGLVIGGFLDQPLTVGETTLSPSGTNGDAFVLRTPLP